MTTYSCDFCRSPEDVGYSVNLDAVDVYDCCGKCYERINQIIMTKAWEEK